MVPNDWSRKALEKIAEVRTGVAKGKKGLNDPIEVPYLRVANVQDGYIDLNEIKTIQIERHQLERYSLKKGDVLMTEGGDFDKLGRGDVWQGQIEPCINQNHVFAVRVDKDKVLPYFLSALSASNYGKTYFLRCAKRSTNLASINLIQLKGFPVIIPPLPEQRKIAKILGTWDKAIATTEKLITTSKQQKKSLMQQLLTGKVRLCSPTGEPFPGAWDEVRLGELSTKVGSGITPKGGSVTYKDFGTPLIRSQNVLWGKLDLSDVVYIDDMQHGKMKSSTVRLHDVLLNITGASIGRVSLSNLDEANVNQHVCIIRCEQRLVPSYLKYFLLSFEGQKQIEQCQAGGNRQGLNFNQIKSFKVLVPSFVEQQKIAQVLRTADKEIETLEAKLAHLQQEKKALMQQLLTGKRRVKVEKELEASN